MTQLQRPSSAGGQLPSVDLGAGDVATRLAGGTPAVSPSELPAVTCVAEAALPTAYGDFRIQVFRVGDSPAESLALVRGDLDGSTPALVRLHSECLTGDLLGSVRCDCGEQLAAALALIADSGCGVLLYLRQEGRGIGLTNKIRAYALQDDGLDTVEANVALGLPVDSREYVSAAALLRHLGITQVRLLTNNPAKREALEQYGIPVVERIPLEIAPNPGNLEYLRTKAARMGHLLSLPGMAELESGGGMPVPGDEPILRSLGPTIPPPFYRAWSRERPRVTIHYAQTLDGRIATRTGSSQWISGDRSLRLAHELRADNEAIMVGVGTVLADTPRLTVRLAPGRSPRRYILDSTLRLQLDAHVLTDGAVETTILTTDRAPADRVDAVRRRGVDVVAVGRDDAGRVALGAAFRYLATLGIASILIEGGREVITSALRGRYVDRLVVCTAPKVLGTGIEGVGDLNILRLGDALAFSQASFTTLGDDVIFDGTLARVPASTS
ncbi:MAG: GTP cyclohydrolase II [Chloroflexi bacterium]|nr:GTP cyclohydrolase II [Chloroflexota bacterium]